MMQIYINFDNVATATVERNDYRIHFCGMTKGEVVSGIKNADLREKKDNNIFYDYSDGK